MFKKTKPSSGKSKFLETIAQDMSKKTSSKTDMKKKFPKR